ncbi:hypothetical protein ANN_06560 [Periplaneta americana]|uniref:Tc1-like transposase DDE domain-containing protein n=1 Tax=Periplaneta americana TaxID=6978 RepID=A0ABQ8TDW3_PERAM|nr:hypothetical protein ANN_06560 [Periplaneta americana]
MDLDRYSRVPFKCVNRRTIHDFYVNDKRVPTIRKLLPVIKDKINFPWSHTTLLKVVKELGFKWKKSQNRRKIPIERPHIVTWRHNYLVCIKNLRQSGRQIFYLDETWIDSNITFGKCWQSEEEFGVQANVNSGNRLIVVHAGSLNGFLDNATLIYKAETATGDYHGQMNSVNFNKWVTEKLVPNLPPASVVVLDNAPYHCAQIDKPPTKYSVKSDITWLRNKGITCDESMRKEALYKLVEVVKPKDKLIQN